MASHELIDAHLAVLAERLPRGIVDELADGLIETWQTHLDAGQAADAAARAAIEEFGAPEQITEAFVLQSPARRLARRLLATGPVVGACWATTFISAHAWTWSLPPAGIAAFGTVLVAVITVLALGVHRPSGYHLARIGGIAGALGTIGLDTMLLATLLVVAPEPSLAFGVAIPASLARIVLTVRHLPALGIR